MSKYCMQCGAQIDDDNAAVCPSCGANQDSAPTANGVDPVIVENPTDGSKKMFPVLIAAAAVVLVVFILILKALFGGSYKDPIDNFCKAMETGKGKYLYKSMPEFMIEDEYDDMKKSEIIDELDEVGEDLLDSLEDEYGDDIKVSYKIKSKEKIDKDDLKDMEDDIEDYYDAKVNVQKGYEVKLRLKIKGDDDDDSEKVTFNVYKIDGKWCMEADSLI
ncbi:MAG: zinc ribbon domain-containing protein [Clostridium sp.]|nr:zinc ribbon domain-containing protein [Clostridium sp.]MCM1548222.1 zinc ribbon domain-containing protein [Ruminococcus sp.]